MQVGGGAETWHRDGNPNSVSPGLVLLLQSDVTSSQGVPQFPILCVSLLAWESWFPTGTRGPEAQGLGGEQLTGCGKRS